MKIINIKNLAAAARAAAADADYPYIYVGRRMGGTPAVEGSPLGNPFKLSRAGAAERTRVLAEYRRWLFGRIEAGDAPVMALLRAIDADTTLACWCVDLEGAAIFNGPERCHAQVIWKAVRYLRQSGRVAGGWAGP